MMFRYLIPIVALPAACAASADSVPSTQAQPLDFTLQDQGERGDLAATFSRDHGRHNQWTTTLAAAQLSGFDHAAFRAANPGPVRFSLNRNSGQLDCSGSGNRGYAKGRCELAPRPQFASLLSQAGVRSPDREEWIELFALDVKRDLVESLRASGFPPPSVDDLVALTAVGVTPEYINAMAAAGYRPRDLDTLVELRAVGVTPEWIAAFARMGLANLPADDLVELRALGIDADYIQSFRAIGYSDLSADDLVQMKALDVTADYARAVERNMGRQSPDKLVELKAVGVAWRQ